MQSLKNAIVIYTDDIQEHYEVLERTEKSTIIGRNLDSEFVDCGFISKRNIKQIKNNGNKKQ